MLYNIDFKYVKEQNSIEINERVAESEIKPLYLSTSHGLCMYLKNLNALAVNENENIAIWIGFHFENVETLDISDVAADCLEPGEMVVC